MGHSSDDETGLLYMRARYYDPVVGRFASEDPGRNGVNWLWYVECDPANRVDPAGHLSEFAGRAAGVLGTLFATTAALIAFGKASALWYALADELAVIATGLFAVAAVGLRVSNDVTSLVGAAVGIMDGAAGAVAVIVCMRKGIQDAGSGLTAGLAKAAVVGAFVYGLTVLGYSIATELG